LWSEKMEVEWGGGGTKCGPVQKEGFTRVMVFEMDAKKKDQSWKTIWGGMEGGRENMEKGEAGGE